MPFCPKCGSQVSEDAQYCPNCGTLIGKPEPPSAPPTPEIAKASVARSFFGRIYGAALLDASVYEEVEADRTATTQALLAVLLGSVSQGIGRALSGIKRVRSYTSRSRLPRRPRLRHATLASVVLHNLLSGSQALRRQSHLWGASPNHRLRQLA